MASAHGIVNTALNPYGAGAAPPVSLGRAGDMLTSNVHGDWYAQTLAGSVYFLATGTAGTTVPVAANNLVSTFTLYNPANSGKNLELISYDYGVLNATTVVSDVSLYYQASVGNLVTAPGTLTVLPIKNALLGASAASVAVGWAAATLAGTLLTTLLKGPTLFSFGAVTTTNAQRITYEFNGRILMPPGTLVTTAGNAAQTQAAQQTLVWAEYAQ